jgi:HlyD family secretion protein
LQGEKGSLVSGVAQVKGRITETRLAIAQIDQDMRSEVGRELADIRRQLSELREKRVAAEDQLRRVEIRSPQDGKVHQLTVHTVGGVISPSEAIMLIVPERDALQVEARIAPNTIDQIQIGQRAVLRFSAFDHRTTPELQGEVSRVSADTVVDQKTGVSFYTVRIALSDAEIKRLKGLTLIPGMPVEAFVQTGERTVISYLVKPLSDQVARAWRER